MGWGKDQPSFVDGSNKLTEQVGHPSHGRHDNGR